MITSNNAIAAIKAKLAEINDARCGAGNTALTWYVEENEVRVCYDVYAQDEGIADCSVSIVNENNVFNEKKEYPVLEFIALAANEITKLTKALELAVDGLDYYRQFSLLPVSIQLKERIGGGKAHETIQVVTDTLTKGEV